MYLLVAHVKSLQSWVQQGLHLEALHHHLLLVIHIWTGSFDITSL